MPVSLTKRTVEVTIQQGVQSEPPTGKRKVVNIYVDPNTGKLVLEYEGEE